MKLSKQTIGHTDGGKVDLPSAACFGYPEKVLQFGTGVLLRALPDYFIDKANKQGIFKGRIVVVKSTDGGDISEFSRQDNLYTVCIRGTENGEKIEENIVNASISRVISAKEDWNAVLACASNPQLQIIISNTTEVGIVLVKDDIHSSPPVSFPGKLLSFLHKRFEIFGDEDNKGLVIIPTELLPDNGKKLLSILLELAEQNRLSHQFIEWLNQKNFFCSSLVDRIVPGKLPPADREKTESSLGYTDTLMIMSENYRLWAVEAKDPKVNEVLSFSRADPGVVIAPDIHIFRELKLRLLNGSHTLSCGLAHLVGFVTVKDAMADSDFVTYVKTLMLEEIAPVITDRNLSLDMAREFAGKVLDRYRNPFIEHRWLSITMQYSSKMKMRDVPILLSYVERMERLPKLIVLGWAAYILFMRSELGNDGQYYGEINGKKYLVNDNQAAYYAAQWSDPARVVETVLSNEELWGSDLTALPGFTEAVNTQVLNLQNNGPKAAIKNFEKNY